MKARGRGQAPLLQYTNWIVRLIHSRDHLRSPGLLPSRLTSHPGFFWHEGLVASRSDLAIDIRWRLQRPIHCEQPLKGNAKDGLVLLEIGSDESPIFQCELSKLTTVELVISHLVQGISYIERPTRSEGEEIPTRIGGFQIADSAILIESDAVH